ncbi:MAG: hypothetical protein U0J70_00130, partial [Atopobiaceae bacterium]|nr:hypothetical protein [Atopobiaceae bacterium]
MASISVGHQVYLYRLFVREIGIGRQTPIARVEEVLVADDVLPCDLGCADTRELLEKLSDFVRLTVFKKGRVYVTVVAQPTWDEALARADKEDSAKRPADKGAKSWKRRRNRGEIQPLRPRPKNRPKIAETVETVEIAEEQVQKQVEKPASESAESAPKTSEPVVVVTASEVGAAPSKGTAPDTEVAHEPKFDNRVEPQATIVEESQYAVGDKRASASNSAQESTTDLAEEAVAEDVAASTPTASQE